MAVIGGHVVNLYKQLGETPRERLERLRTERPQYQYDTLSYAGRLDPMAEGVLLCMVGAAVNRREEFLDLPKEYVLDILFGFSTDTYDVLGKVMESGDPAEIVRSKVDRGLNEFRGLISQEYPPYSSKPVAGKSLFEWARQGLAMHVLPQKTVTIYEIETKAMYKIKEPQLLKYIEESIGKVKGDFRQEEILSLWHRNLRADGTREFPCATVRISCSSGTYMRSIAQGLGVHLGMPALALHILRTKVGDYGVEKALR